MKARELVVAPRLPERSKAHTGNPFTSQGDIVADCELCGYHAMGSRPDVKRAMDDHRAMYHSTQTSVVLLNQPRQ